MPSAAPTTVAGGGGTKPKWNDDEVEQAAVARFDIFMVKLQNQNSLFTKSRVQQKFLQFNSLQGAAAIHTSHSALSLSPSALPQSPYFQRAPP